MTSTKDTELIAETFKFMLTKSRDQDIVYFFRGLSMNNDTRRPLVKFFKDEYDVVSFPDFPNLHVSEFQLMMTPMI